MTGLTTLELAKESFHFSVAHFTLFSPTQRERLHGHNYSLRCRIRAQVGEDGLAFDYTDLKQALKDVCASMDEYTLMPESSPWLKVRTAERELTVEFDGARFVFPSGDVRLLPVANITLEALAQYLLDTLLERAEFDASRVASITLGVSSSPGMWADVTREL